MIYIVLTNLHQTIGSRIRSDLIWFKGIFESLIRDPLIILDILLSKPELESKPFQDGQPETPPKKVKKKLLSDSSYSSIDMCMYGQLSVRLEEYNGSMVDSVSPEECFDASNSTTNEFEADRTLEPILSRQVSTSDNSSTSTRKDDTSGANENEVTMANPCGLCSNRKSFDITTEHGRNQLHLYLAKKKVSWLC